MSEDDFIEKWITDDLRGTPWGEDASHVFWARAYEFDERSPLLLEMSNDLLDIQPAVRTSSARQLANCTIAADKMLSKLAKNKQQKQFGMFLLNARCN